MPYPGQIMAYSNSMISSRIEDAILRYQKKRRIENDRLAIFRKYLAYGGIDVGPRMFAGVDHKDMKDMDSEQILIARMGQTSIKSERAKLPIDFDAVVRGFLTAYFPYYFSPESEEKVELATATIHNFLSYILYHDVCPEYKENIEEARKSCNVAAKQLWKNQQFTANGPGDFNLACSILFGDFLENLSGYDDNNESQWDKVDPQTYITRHTAEKVIRVVLAAVGTEAQVLKFHELVTTENKICARYLDSFHGFEVTAVCLPDEDVRAFYDKHAADLNPVGKLYGKGYRDPGKPAYDLTEEEEKEWDKGETSEFQFFVEADILQHCYPGMKVITPVWEVDAGFHFFEDIQTAYCSNYTVLLNDLVLGWQPPKDLTSKSSSEVEDLEDDGEIDLSLIHI